MANWWQHPYYLAFCVCVKLVSISLSEGYGMGCWESQCGVNDEALSLYPHWLSQHPMMYPCHSTHTPSGVSSKLGIPVLTMRAILCFSPLMNHAALQQKLPYWIQAQKRKRNRKYRLICAINISLKLHTRLSWTGACKNKNYQTPFNNIPFHLVQ